jgi:cytochrome c biogenesis protein CcdA
VLAAQSRDLFQVSVTMLLFAVGVAVPLVAIGLLSCEALMRWRGRMLATGKGGKLALGAVLLLTGVLLLSGWDKQVEAAALRFAPDWLVDLTTRY